MKLLNVMEKTTGDQVQIHVNALQKDMNPSLLSLDSRWIPN